MKKKLWIFVAILFCVSLFSVPSLFAEDTVVPAATNTEEAVPATAVSEGTTLKEELAQDKETIKTKKNEVKTNAQAARSEEKALREQIREARKAGDTEKTKELQAQLKTMHQENVKQMRQDRKQLHTAKKELRKDRKAKGRSGR